MCVREVVGWVWGGGERRVEGCLVVCWWGGGGVLTIAESETDGMITCNRPTAYFTGSGT